MFNIVGGSHGSQCTPGGCWHSIITHGYKIGCLMGYGVQNVVLYCQSKSQLLFETSIPCLLPNAQSIYSAKISPSRAKTKLSFRSKSNHTYIFNSYQLFKQTFTGERQKLLDDRPVQYFNYLCYII